MARTFNRVGEPLHTESRPIIHNDQVSEEPEQLEEIFGLGKKKPKFQYVVGIGEGSSTNADMQLRDTLEKVIRRADTEKVTVKQGNAPGNLFAYKTAYYITFICTEDERKDIQNHVNNNIVNAPGRDQAARDALKDRIMWGRGKPINEELETPEQLEEAVNNWYKQEW